MIYTIWRRPPPEALPEAKDHIAPDIIGNFYRAWPCVFSSIAFQLLFDSSNGVSFFACKPSLDWVGLQDY
jgi:hypothetical protein